MVKRRSRKYSKRRRVSKRRVSKKRSSKRKVSKKRSSRRKVSKKRSSKRRVSKKNKRSRQRGGMHRALGAYTYADTRLEYQQQIDNLFNELEKHEGDECYNLEIQNLGNKIREKNIMITRKKASRPPLTSSEENVEKIILLDDISSLKKKINKKIKKLPSASPCRKYFNNLIDKIGDININIITNTTT
tara:strand:+ start:98 stop:661 length:564 start_codon:yes stop_codon:yes gene_type:complete